MQRLKKYLKNFCHDQQRWGGTIFRFCGGDTTVVRGDIELKPPVPPTRENSGNDTSTSLLHDKVLKFFTEMFDYSDKTHCFAKFHYYSLKKWKGQWSLKFI